MQFPYIEDYPYVGMDLRNDEDLALPFRAQWDAIGIAFEKQSFSQFEMFLFLRYLNIFGCTKGFYHIVYHVALPVGVSVLER